MARSGSPPKEEEEEINGLLYVDGKVRIFFTLRELWRIHSSCLDLFGKWRMRKTRHGPKSKLTVLSGKYFHKFRRQEKGFYHLLPEDHRYHGRVCRKNIVLFFIHQYILFFTVVIAQLQKSRTKWGMNGQLCKKKSCVWSYDRIMHNTNRFYFLMLSADHISGDSFKPGFMRDYFWKTLPFSKPVSYAFWARVFSKK